MYRHLLGSCSPVRHPATLFLLWQQYLIPTQLLSTLESILTANPLLLLLSLQDLLTACQHSLSSWSPMMITCTFLFVGRMLNRWPTELHQDLMAAVSSWQQAAVAALQPHLEQLPAECLVHLLLGNHRITERLAKNADQHGSNSGTDIGAVAAGAAAAGVLAAVVAAAVARMGELGPGQLCDLLRALSGVTGVRGTVACEVMDKLQPHLR